MPNSEYESNNNNKDDHQKEVKNAENEREWQEIEIKMPWGHIAGKWYGNRDVQPILALHGWQDNAGSFDRLIPLLPSSIPILSIDLPGHGKSSHFPIGMHYYLFWDYVPLIRRIVRHFSWKKIKLLGHSMGGAIAFMYAACFPDDVEQFISIDLYGPPVRDLNKNASMTGTCIDKMLDYELLPSSKQPCYQYDEMISLVVDGYGGSINRDSAKILMIRGMKDAPCDLASDGFFFSRDLRLKVSILGLFSLDQVLAYAELIKCPVLNIRAKPGKIQEREEIYSIVIDALRKTTNVEYHEVEGTHHVHLNNPERVSPIIGKFLLNPISSQSK